MYSQGFLGFLPQVSWGSHFWGLQRCCWRSLKIGTGLEDGVFPEKQANSSVLFRLTGIVTDDFENVPVVRISGENRNS